MDNPSACGHGAAMAGMVTEILPPLREELILHPAPTAADGSPCWILSDPTRNHFFHINWLAFEILSRWHGASVTQIVQRIIEETPLTVRAEDVADVVKFLAHNHLLRSEHPAQSHHLAQIVQAQKGRWLHWLLHHYLFFRIPLTQPDFFLSRTLHWMDFFFSAAFSWFLFGVGVLALFLLLRQWDIFQATLLTHIVMTDFESYLITLIGVKGIHELGHAYTAKRYGCRIPTMGVAFLVLLPMLYTDTTEAWKLPYKKQRLAIALGGLKAEGALAVLSLLAWNLLPLGMAKEMAFWIATTSLSTTLAINLSPFMRFDGYFVFSDWLDLPNLHERSFQMGRWWLREFLFGLDVSPPELASSSRHLFFILFAFSTWLYRLLLFLGISLLVYHFFIKVVGIVLFLVEIGWFIVLPIWREVQMWPTLRPLARTPWRLPMIFIFLLMCVLVPWSHHVTAWALVQGEEMVRFYVSEDVSLEQMPVPQRGRVRQGEVLFVLQSPDIKRQQQLARLRMGSSAWEISAGGLNIESARRARMAQEEREHSVSTLTGLQATAARLILTAPFAGEMVDIPTDLAVGSWLRMGMHLGTLVDRTHLAVEAYLNEESIKRIHLGARGRFIPEIPEYSSLDVYLQQMDVSGVSQLDEPLLSSLTGGPIAVKMQKDLPVPEAALFRVRLQADAVSDWSPLRLRGTLHLEADPQSLLERWTQTVLMVLVREWEM
ncbi:MAG: peptidase M50 [Magnetococcus sp. DMHC-6]